MRLIFLKTAVVCTLSICFSSSEKLLHFSEEGNILQRGFITIILHCLNLEDSACYIAFVPSFKIFEVHMGKAVRFWQCLNVFFSIKNKIFKHLKIVVGTDLWPLNWTKSPPSFFFYCPLLSSWIYLESHW